MLKRLTKNVELDETWTCDPEYEVYHNVNVIFPIQPEERHKGKETRETRLVLIIMLY